MTTLTLNGTVRGQTIELDSPLHVPDGERVRLRIDLPDHQSTGRPNEDVRTRLMKSFGMWADRVDIPADGVEYMDEIRRGHRLDEYHSDEAD